MPARFLGLVSLMLAIILTGCAGLLQLNFQGPVAAEFLDGNYQRLASCTFDRLGGSRAQLTKADLPQRGLATITAHAGSEKRWELAFNDEDGGRQTRLEVLGSHPGEHVLAIARACAA